MEVIGGVSAAASLLGQLIAFSNDVGKFIHNIKYARRDIKMLQAEIDSCKTLCKIFDSTTKPIGNKTMEIARKEGLDKSIQKQVEFAHEQIYDLLDRLKPLDKYVDSTVFEQTLAKVRWHFSKDGMQLPIATLSSVKSSLALLSTLVMLGDRIASALQPGELGAEERETLMQEIKALKGVIRRTKAAWEKAKKDIQRLDHNHHNACMANLDKIGNVMQPLTDKSVSQARRVTRDLSLSLSSSSTSSRSHEQQSNTISSATTQFSSISDSRWRISNTRHRSPNNSHVSRNDSENAAGSRRPHYTLTADSQALVPWHPPDADVTNEQDEMIEMPVYRDYGDGHRESYVRRMRRTDDSVVVVPTPTPTTLSQTSRVPPLNEEEDSRETPHRRRRRRKRRRRDSQVD